MGGDVQDSAHQGEPDARMRSVVEQRLSPGVVDVLQAQKKYDRVTGFAQKSPLIGRLLSRYAYADPTNSGSGDLVFSNAHQESSGKPPVVARGSYASPESGSLREPGAVLQKKETTDHSDQSPRGHEAKEQPSKGALSALPGFLQQRVQRKESPGVIDTKQAHNRYERTTPLAAQRVNLIGRLSSRWTQAGEGLEQKAVSTPVATGSLLNRVLPAAHQEFSAPQGSPGLAPVGAEQPGKHDGLSETPVMRAATRDESFPDRTIARVAEQSEAGPQETECRDASWAGSAATGERSAPIMHFSPTNGFRLSRKKITAAGSGIDTGMRFSKPSADAPKTEMHPEARPGAETGNGTIQTAGSSSWTGSAKESAAESKGPVHHRSEAPLVVRRKTGQTESHLNRLSDTTPNQRREGRGIEGPQITEAAGLLFSSAAQDAPGSTGIPRAEREGDMVLRKAEHSRAETSMIAGNAKPGQSVFPDSGFSPIQADQGTGLLRSSMGNENRAQKTGNGLEAKRPDAASPSPAPLPVRSLPGVQREDATHHPLVHRVPATARATAGASEAVLQRRIIRQAPADSQHPAGTRTIDGGSTAVDAFRDTVSDRSFPDPPRVHGALAQARVTDSAGEALLQRQAMQQSPASSPLLLRQASVPKGHAATQPDSSTGTTPGSGVVAELRAGSAPIQPATMIWRSSAEHATKTEAFPFETRSSRNQALPLSLGARAVSSNALSRQVARAAAEAPATENAATTGDAGPAPQAPMQAGGVDVALLAEQVSRLLGRQLETERERRGVGL